MYTTRSIHSFFYITDCSASALDGYRPGKAAVSGIWHESALVRKGLRTKLWIGHLDEKRVPVGVWAFISNQREADFTDALGSYTLRRCS